MNTHTSEGDVANFGGQLDRWVQRLYAHWRFKFVLPSVREVCLHGVRLDVRDLSLVMRNKLLLGRYEAQERRLAEKYLSPSDAVLEMGGAIGFLGLYCQKHLGISRFATVEANPHTAGLLRRNYALNGVAPLLFNVAVADRDGEVDLDIGGEFLANSILSTEPTLKTRVPALRFESLLQRLCFPVDALIIDVEGAEKFVDWRLLPKTVNKIIMEIHPAIIGISESYLLIAKLVNEGFSVEEEAENVFFFKKTLA